MKKCKNIDATQIDGGKDSGVEEQDAKSVSSPLSDTKLQSKAAGKGAVTFVNHFCNDDNENCIHYEDENEDDEQPHQNNENNCKISNGNEEGDGDEDDGEGGEDGEEDTVVTGCSGSNGDEAENDIAKVESTSLVGYDGVKFVATYLVVMSTINNV